MIRNVAVRMLGLFLAFLTALPFGAFAQDETATTAMTTGQTTTFKQEELDQMLAPIALYPDSLVSQILMASTYPVEIVEADRWMKENKDLKGDDLTNALEQQNWDPSVKSLVNFPDVLDMMDQKLDWTQKMGDAFLAQQKDVMNSIQNLRKKAAGAGSLKTSAEQTVTVDQGTNVVIIEPANPSVVYVPVYDPAVVYGPWWYPDYPPYAYYPPGYVPGRAFAFAAGVAVGAAWGYAWGYPDWRNGEVNVNVNRNIEYNRNINRDDHVQKWKDNHPPDAQGNYRFQHDADHRRDAIYRDEATARQFNRPTSFDADRSLGDYRDRAAASRDSAGRFGEGDFQGGARERAGAGGGSFRGRR